MNSPAYYLLQQFAYVSPQILVYLAGVALGIFFIKKYGTSAMLVLGGSGVLLITTIGQTLLQVYLFRVRINYGWSAADYARVLSMVAVLASLLRALGLALWLIAVFIGRKTKTTTQP
ncbi:MAG: hypothetical protein AABM67_02925 [Acidobacteriota bacterium]